MVTGYLLTFFLDMVPMVEMLYSKIAQVVIIVFVLGGTSLAMPPHPRNKNPIPFSEKSVLGSGGIRLNSDKSMTRKSVLQIRSRANRLLILRANFTGSTPEFDTFSLGAAENVYDIVKAQVERYFKDQSRDQHLVELRFPKMEEGIAFPNTHQFYGSASQDDVENGVLSVLNQWDPYIDYAQFDSVFIMHAGTGHEAHDGNETLINSFRSTLTNPYESPDGATIHSFIMVPEHYYDNVDSVTGVLIHEYGHELGLPDLYDTTFQSEGIGNWGVMAGGSYGGPGNDGTIPVGFCAWSKIFLGWEEPEIVYSSSNTLKHPAVGGKIFKIYAESSSGPSEYFLLENRFNGDLSNFAFNWDQFLPMDGSQNPTGILILHVDEKVAFQDAGNEYNRWDGNQLQVITSHKFLDVEEASTLQDLDTKDAQSDATDTWSSSSSVPFSQLDPFLAEPYSGNPNGLSITFLDPTSESMDITVAQTFQLISRDSSIPGILLLGFSSEVASIQTTSFYNFSPSLGSITVERVNPGLVEIRHSSSIDRATEYTLSFSGAIGAVGETPPSITNIFGTNVTVYIIQGGQVWTHSQSPYVLTEDLFIESASRLVLESGAVVLIDSSASGSFPSTRIDITVKGQIFSNGTAQNPVQFLPRNNSSSPSWGTILLGAPDDKPALFAHTRIKAGGVGNNGCLSIRDGSEHIIAYSEIESCIFGLRVGENYSTQTEGSLRGGGAKPRVYQNVFKDSERSLLLDSSNSSGLYLNNTFKDFQEIALNFQALTAGGLENFRFYNFEGFKISDPSPVFEFANTSGNLQVLNLSQLNEFHVFRKPDPEANCNFLGAQSPCSSPCDRCSLMQFDANAVSIIGEQNSTLQEPVSTDFNMSLIEFLPEFSSQPMTTITTVGTFRIRVEADSVTNHNATTRRLLAVKLVIDSSDHPVLIPLEEEAPNSKIFISKPISTGLTGVTSSTFLVLEPEDTLKAEDLASGLKRELTVHFLSSPLPEAPSISSLTTATNPFPIWTWISGGNGNGIYRYKLDADDLSIDATETTSTRLEITERLPDGFHTLYVQERNDEGSWSESGESAVLIDTFVPTPSVSGLTSTTVDPPLFTWISGGFDGNGTFRYQLNDASFTALSPTTTATFLLPTNPLGVGEHTIYVQEQDGFGNWSASGSFTTTIVPGIKDSLFSFRQNFQANRSVIEYQFAAIDSLIISTAQLEFSTDGLSWNESSALASISTEVNTTYSISWLPFYDLPIGYKGEVSLRLTLSTADEQTYFEVITFSYEATDIETNMLYSLGAGWNLIAVYPGANSTAGAYFSALSSQLTSCAYTYQGDQFYHFCPESIEPPQGSTSTALEGSLIYGSGFWIHVDADLELALPSIFRPDYVYPIKRGWNLVSPGQTTLTAPVDLPNQIKLLVDYLPSEGYRALQPNSQIPHNHILNPLRNSSLTRAVWLYSSADSTFPNLSLPEF